MAAGGWWSPYGDTEEEIRENMKTGEMPNAPDAMRVGPSKYFTGTKKGDDHLSDFLGDDWRAAPDRRKKVTKKGRKRVRRCLRT